MLELTDEEIKALLARETVGRFAPLCAEDAALEERYRGLIEDICKATGASERGEWESWGQGHASFFEAWLYFDEDRAADKPAMAEPWWRAWLPARRRAASSEREYEGVAVLLSRQTCFYAIAQSRKFWDTARGCSGGGMSEVEGIDDVTDPRLQALVREVDANLQRAGLRRLHHEELARPIGPAHHIETNLQSPGGFHQFDVLFNWMD